MDKTTRGDLVSESGEKVKLFREIDRIKLGEIEAAYLNFKRNDKATEKGNEVIKKFLEPPKKEPTEEEKKQTRIELYTTEWNRLKNENQVYATPIFIDLIMQEKKEVNIAYVLATLQNFKPQTNKTGLTTKTDVLPKIIQNDAKTFFVNQFVSTYIQRNKLNKLTLEEWINHWEVLYQKKTK